jgi:hypothetical protein
MTYVCSSKGYRIKKNPANLISHQIYSKDQFTSKVEESTEPVFIFILPTFYSDFSPEIQRFAETYPQSKIYGIVSSESPEVLEHLTGKFKVSTVTEFILWRDKIKVIEYSRGQLSDLMTVLKAIKILAE